MVQDGMNCTNSMTINDKAKAFVKEHRENKLMCDGELIWFLEEFAYEAIEFHEAEREKVRILTEKLDKLEST